MLNFFYKNKKNFNVFLYNFLKKTHQLYFNHFYLYECKKWGFDKKVLLVDKTSYSLLPKVFRPSGYSIRLQYVFYILRCYFTNSWKFYRQFFGYTVFGNTRTNSKSIKKYSIKLKNVLLRYVYKNKFRRFDGRDKILALHIETLNKLWFFQWYLEWKGAWFKFCDFLKTSRKRFKFGVYFSKKNKGLNYIPRPQKKNKKKIILPQDTFNIGFFFNFTRGFRKEIAAGKAIK